MDFLTFCVGLFVSGVGFGVLIAYAVVAVTED